MVSSLNATRVISSASSFELHVHSYLQDSSSVDFNVGLQRLSNSYEKSEWLRRESLVYRLSLRNQDPFTSRSTTCSMFSFFLTESTHAKGRKWWCLQCLLLKYLLLESDMLHFCLSPIVSRYNREATWNLGIQPLQRRKKLELWIVGMHLCHVNCRQ